MSVGSIFFLGCLFQHFSENLHESMSDRGFDIISKRLIAAFDCDDGRSVISYFPYFLPNLTLTLNPSTISVHFPIKFSLLYLIQARANG